MCALARYPPRAIWAVANRNLDHDLRDYDYQDTYRQDGNPRDDMCYHGLLAPYPFLESSVLMLLCITIRLNHIQLLIKPLSRVFMEDDVMIMFDVPCACVRCALGSAGTTPVGEHLTPVLVRHGQYLG